MWASCSDLVEFAVQLRRWEDMKSNKTVSVAACVHVSGVFSVIFFISLPPSLLVWSALVNLLISESAGKNPGPADSALLWKSPSLSYECLPWLQLHNELMLAPIGMKYCSPSDHSVASALN